MSESITLVLVSAAIGGIVSFIGAVINNALEKRTRIDESLRDTRIQNYQVLWKLTGLFPQYPKTPLIRKEKLSDLSTHLKDWYYDRGGIFLSGNTRIAYSNLQKSIHQVIENGKNDPISDSDYALIRLHCSKLRTELTKDLQSRNRAFLTA
jgi:hypothetical protein